MTGERTEFCIVDAASPDSVRLLERAYHELYLPAFPAAEERDGLDLWLACINRGRELVAIIAGENLSRPEEAVLHGFSVAYYLADANAGWMCYNVSDPNRRGRGLGRKMFDARVDALKELSRAQGYQQLDGVFLELENPARIAQAQSSVDPVKRMKLYSSWGARIIPIDYVQPETASGGERCRTLLLMAYPVEGRHPGPDTVRRFLTALYGDYREEFHGQDYDPASSMTNDPDFAAMSRQIDEWQAREEAAAADSGEIKAA